MKPVKKIVELPLIEPLISTYHHQGAGLSAIINNPSVINWYLNNAISLVCNRDFLFGNTTPKITIEKTHFNTTHCFDTHWYDMRYTKGYINPIIHTLIDNGYYLYFTDFDDYYLDGKSWYNRRHFEHDGCIIGYNQNEKSYCVYAYDENWIYRKFWIPQKSFDKARQSSVKRGKESKIFAYKPSINMFELDTSSVLSGIEQYLNSDLNKYPINETGPVFGIVVHTYIAMYIDKIINQSIPYEKADRRIFRLIWDHKKLMLERLIRTEKALSLPPIHSEKYKEIVSTANSMRMLYASFFTKKRYSLLLKIKKMLIELNKQETLCLKNFLCVANEVI